MFQKYFEKRREQKLKLKELRKETGIFREYFELITETLVYVFFVMCFLLQSFVIPTGSMIDNLLIGDHLLVNKVAYAPSLGLVDSLVFPPAEIKRGMIVTFRAPLEMEKEYVKRVIALPGETIKIVKQQVYIDGKPLAEDYKRHYSKTAYAIEGDKRIWERYLEEENGQVRVIKTIIDDRNGTRDDEQYIKGKDGSLTAVDPSQENPAPSGSLDSGREIPINYWYGDNFPFEYLDYDEVDPRFNLKKSYRSQFIDTDIGLAFKVPEGHYFCLGDNRDNSLDSRFWGPVPREFITGKPWRIYWSYESSTEEYLTPGVGHKLKDILKTFTNFFSRTRWSRTLMKVK